MQIRTVKKLKYFFYFVLEANPEGGKMYLIETADEQISLKSGY